MATLMTGGALGDDLSPVEATQDALFGGSVVLFQPPRGAGYRTNVDALLLAGFATAAKVASRGVRPRGRRRGRRARAAAPRGSPARRFRRDRRPSGVHGAAQPRRERVDRPGRGRPRRRERCCAREAGRGIARRLQPAVHCPRSRSGPRRPSARAQRRGGDVRRGRAPGSRAEGARVLRLPRAGAGCASVDTRGRGPPRQAAALRTCRRRSRPPASRSSRPRRPGREGCASCPPLFERGARGYTPEMQALLAIG